MEQYFRLHHSFLGWLLESWRWHILGRVKMRIFEVPWQMTEEGTKRRRKVDI